ncbi:MAG: response regulator [Elusimicrobia bacterium]|nr:response regulator [Elusimicrobiota bacterium]
MSAKILIVDDEPDMRLVLTQLLGSRGFLVESAGAGADALAAYSPGTYALVLVDQCLQDMYGWEVAEGLLKADPAANIIMMTGNLDPKDAAEGWPKGVLGWIEKPFSVDELFAFYEKKTGRPLRAAPGP